MNYGSNQAAWHFKKESLYFITIVAATKRFVMIIQQPFTQMVTIFSTVKKFVTEPINEHYEAHMITVQVQEFERNRIVQ